MILRLVREQMRSMWKYTAWMIGLASLAVALATFALCNTSTSIAFSIQNPSLTGLSGGNMLFVNSYGGDRINEAPPAEDGGDGDEREGREGHARRQERGGPDPVSSV